MQVTEILAEGLKRKLEITVPAADLAGRLDKRLAEMKDQVRINGFRPGKVPAGHLKRLVGRQEMAKVIDEVIGEAVKNAVDERKQRPALNPDIDLPQDGVEAILDGNADLTFTAAYELLPEIVLVDHSGITVERPVVTIDDAEIDEQIERIAAGSKPFTDKGEGAVAASGDKLNIDFLGKVDGVAFDGGTAQGIDLVIGSGQFIPGFEEQLIGATAGSDVLVNVTFPADYGAENLAGKAATFECKVNTISAPGELALDDEFAKKLGIESFDKLKDAIRDSINSRYAATSRQKVKRQLLDKLDELYKLDVPPKLVEGEFEQIWKQVTDDLAQSGKSFADEDTSEEAARADYLKIAERRVRLGLVLSEIGEKNAVQVTDQEVQQALIERVRQFPGQEKQVFDYYRSNPMALATLRAPLYEEKVVDYLVTQVQVSDKAVTKEELMKEDDADTEASAA
ncbi:MAG: trigger factor [Hyphomicrobiaceae bacterium]|nr:trigger factor [Hyphomicrobiaceae bacterium]